MDVTTMDASVAPAGFSWKSDAWRLGAILLLTLVVRGWLVSHSVVGSRDSLGFVRYVLQLEDPPALPENPDSPLTRRNVIQQAEHPPGFALAAWAVSVPVRSLMGGTNCDALVLSTQITSVLACLLLTLPMYGLGKLLFDRQTAFVATLLFQCLPVWAQVSSDGESDGLYLLTAATALWFGGMAFSRPSGWRFLGCGASCGAAYLIRPEGLLLLAVIASFTLCSRWLGGWSWRQAVGRCLLVLLGAGLLGGPYVALTGRITNKPTGNSLLTWLFSLRWLHGEKAEEVLHNRDNSALPAGTNLLIGEWWNEKFNHGQSRFLWAAKALARESFKTAHYATPFLAVVGIVALHRRFRSEMGLLLLLGVALGYAVMLVVLAVGIGYLSERHCLLLALMSCYFAAAAVPVMGEWLTHLSFLRHRLTTETCSALVAFALFLSSFLGDFRVMHAGRAGHRAAGAWLAKEIRPGEMIWDPFSWAEFYSGRAMKVMPMNNVLGTGPIYIIQEPTNASSHSRLWMIDPALPYIPTSTPVYHYPPSEPLEKAQVVIYKWEPKK